MAFLFISSHSRSQVSRLRKSGAGVLGGTGEDPRYIARLPVGLTESRTIAGEADGLCPLSLPLPPLPPGEEGCGMLQSGNVV